MQRNGKTGVKATEQTHTFASIEANPDRLSARKRFKKPLIVSHNLPSGVPYLSTSANHGNSVRIAA